MCVCACVFWGWGRGGVTTCIFQYPCFFITWMLLLVLCYLPGDLKVPTRERPLTIPRIRPMSLRIRPTSLQIQRIRPQCFSKSPRIRPCFYIGVPLGSTHGNLRLRLDSSSGIRAIPLKVAPDLCALPIVPDSPHRCPYGS